MQRWTTMWIAAALTMGAGAVGCTSGGSEGAVGASSHALVVSLPGSNFEIDDSANLIVDGVDGGVPDAGLDWVSVTEDRQTDDATGSNDSSFAGGTKEDDTCPGTTTGSIPNNKSDLIDFGVYVEPGAPGFLNLFWRRVNEPTGTTLIDFELNRNRVSDPSATCNNGVNPDRSVGDLLIEYRIAQGGATAEIRIREWDGTQWGPEQDLTAIGAATGTINQVPIPAAESDGLITTGEISPRTFGEAQIDLTYILDDTQCTSFGSAFVKSRASTSFTSQLKDYIPPRDISISNCAQVTIRKETTPDGLTDTFAFTHNLVTDDPTTGTSFMLADGGSQVFANVLLNGSTGTPVEYQVSEDTLPAGFSLDQIVCTTADGLTEGVDLFIEDEGGLQRVRFTLDSVDDELDCTFYNSAPSSITVVKETTAGTGTFPFSSSSLTPAAFDLTPTASGSGGADSRSFNNLLAGTYDASEAAPTGWNLDSATCSDGSSPSSIDLGAGEDVTCTFVNDPLTDILCSVTPQTTPAATQSTITCTNRDGGATIGTSSSGSLGVTGLSVGTYDCELVISGT